MSASLAIEGRIRPSFLRRYRPYLIAWSVPAALTGFLHLRAVGLVDTAGSEAITWLQGIVAVVANALGPWAGHVVALVDLPNAGLRGFNVYAAAGLTVVYASNAIIGAIVQHPVQRRILFGQFLALTTLWYGYGFYLITDGLF